MGLVANEKIVDVIKSKYGNLSDENIKRYFLEEFYISSSGYTLTEEMYLAFKQELDNLLNAQNLSYEDVTFLGAGQTFSGIGVGDLVLKVGSKRAPVYDLPYRLSPIYSVELSDRFGIFVSQKADTKNISEKDTQDMYNLIRDTGGIWLDVKSENLGRVKNKVDVSSLGLTKVNERLDSFDTNLASYNGDEFLIDYEDVVYLTPQIREKILNYEPVNLNAIKREIVRDNTDIDEMYYQGYIVNSNKLLEYEERYQRQKGNIDKAERCKSQLKENRRKSEQREYELEQVYRYGRRTGNIGKKYSVKEIGIRVAQATNFSRMKSIVQNIKNKIELRRHRKEKGKNLDIKLNNPMDVEEISFENVDFSEVASKDFDPYTTR